MIQKKDLFFMVVISAIFLFLTAYNIYCVGFSSDELSPGLWGVYFLKGSLSDFRSDININILGKGFPVNLMQTYVFALPSYMLIPFFILFGTNVFSIKLLSITLSWASIIMFYYAVLLLFNKRIAIISALLVALSPTFIHYTRIGLHVTETILNFFFIGGIFFTLLYYRRRKFFYACIASYLLGAGLSVKLSFLPRLIGLLCAVAVLFRKDVSNFIKVNFRPRHIILLAVFFFLGAFLFVYYNIATRGNTFKLLRYLYPGEITANGINNTSIAKNIKTRIKHFKYILTEDTGSEGEGLVLSVPQRIWPLLQLNKKIMLFFFLCALILNLVFLLKNAQWKTVLAAYITYSVMFLFTFFTPASMRIFHMFLLFPFPQLMISVFIDNLASIVKRSLLPIIWKASLVVVILVIILTPMLITDVYINFAYHANLISPGGVFIWSPVIYEIVRYIKIKGINKYHFYCTEGDSWNFILPFITEDALSFHYDLDRAANKDSLYDNLKGILDKETVTYFIAQHASRHFDLLRSYMVKLNRHIVQEASFYGKIREPLFHLYRVER